jgi:hypothetical protein
MTRPIHIQVANGQLIQSSSELKQVVWSIWEQEFTSDLRVIFLHYYDLVVGMDWLEAHSPMKVGWFNKWMLINYFGSSVQLYGIQASLLELSVVEVMLINEVEATQGV